MKKSRRIYNSFHEFVIEQYSGAHTVLELGSGAGSLLLAAHFNLYSIEEDPAFLGLYENITYLHAPVVTLNGVTWYDRERLKYYLPKIGGYDVMIVDGPKGSRKRRGLFENFDLFDLSIPWIIDDTNRATEAQLARYLSSIVNRPRWAYKCKNKEFTVI